MSIESSSRTAGAGRGLLARAAALSVAALLLSACSSDDENGYNTAPASRAFVATRAADYSSGQIERISLSAGDSHDGSYFSTGSDISVAADATHIYQIGRTSLDSISKWDPDNPATLVYQRSVAGDEVFANPYQIVFADITRAYIIRYGSAKIWIVDPSASQDEDFKTGELDLSAYADGDSVPGASGAVLIADKLFVLMERLESFQVTRQGYIAVFDTTTGEEIDTGMGAADGLKGIALGVENPTALQLSDSDGLLYALGRGNYFKADDSDGDRFSGGVVSIDPQSYQVANVLDDGDEQNNQGLFIDMLVVDSAQAYLVTQASFGDNTLRRFNPAEGLLVDGAVAGLSGSGITTLARGPGERLWVGRDGDEPGFTLLKLADDSIQSELLPTLLVPFNAVFLDTRNP